MRNFLEYPVTDEEKIALLTELEKEFWEEGRAKMIMGDMRPLILGLIRKDLEDFIELRDKPYYDY